MMFPGLACRPDGTPYPFVVRCIGVGTMGGYETREAAQVVRDGYQNQPRPKNKPNPAATGR